MFHFFKQFIKSNPKAATPKQTKPDTKAPSTVKNDKRARQEYWAKIYSLIVFLRHQESHKPTQHCDNPLFMRPDFADRKISARQKAARRYLALKTAQRTR